MKKLATIILSIVTICFSLTCVACNMFSKIDFFDIVGEITGKEVTSDNVPYYFTIGEDGSFCTIDTNPFDLDDHSSSVALEYIKEMNKKLELPDYVYQEMLSTSYSQGKQTITHDDISVTWYYHPDKGLNVTYKKI